MRKVRLPRLTFNGISKLVHLLSPPPPPYHKRPIRHPNRVSITSCDILCACLLLKTNTIRQSFSDYGGGVGHTPGTRSTRSTPRGNNGSGGGFSNHGNGGVSAAPTYTSGTGTASSATPRGGNSGGSKGKWESTALRKQRRSSSTSDGGLDAGNDEDGGGVKRGPQSEGALWREQSSSFARDFIRGAGIHRLDPRRLWGEKTA